MKSYSQYGQDTYAYNNFFKGKKNGKFLEIGADDGVTYSNTKFFEDLGWAGICIEPRPNAFELLTKNRKCICENIALDNKEGEVEFLSIHGYGKGLSGIVDNYETKHWNRANGQETKNSKKEIIKVKTHLLHNILENHNMNDIDFCSLDVEGSEMNILQTIDFNKTNIRVFTIENNYSDPKLRQFMTSQGYKFKGRVNIDDIYVKV
jgi:FkbM family methyltransferase